MARYIDAEWLLNFFEPYPDDYHTPLGTLRACVDDAPSVDITFCKDCDFASERQSKVKGMKYCRIHYGWVHEDRFCAWSDIGRKE